MKILHSELPAFYFDPVGMRLSSAFGGPIYLDKSPELFKSIGAFFEYADLNYDCIVLLDGLGSFREIEVSEPEDPTILGTVIRHEALRKRVSVRYFGYKAPSKHALKNFF